MGYTHYFTQKSEVPVAKWSELTAAVKKVFDNFPEYSTSAGGFYTDQPIKVQFEDDDAAPPEIGDVIIRFNGEGDYGHETFMIGQDFDPNGTTFNFCKTARKPYDYAVCAVLILLDHYAPGCYDISSDGEPDDWLPVLSDLRELFEDDSIKLPKELQKEWIKEGGEFPEPPQRKEEKPLFNSVNQWF
jgi:hypothetical protein